MEQEIAGGILIIEGNEVYELDEECLEEKAGEKNCIAMCKTAVKPVCFEL